MPGSIFSRPGRQVQWFCLLVSPEPFLPYFPTATVLAHSLIISSWIAVTVFKWLFCHPVCASLQLVLQNVARELFIGKPVQSWNSPAWNAPLAFCPPAEKLSRLVHAHSFSSVSSLPPPPRMPSAQQCTFLPPDLCTCCCCWVAHLACPCFPLLGLIPTDLSDLSLDVTYITNTCGHLLCARHGSEGFILYSLFTSQNHKRKEGLLSPFYGWDFLWVMKELFSLAQFFSEGSFHHCLALDFDLYAVYTYTCLYNLFFWIGIST